MKAIKVSGISKAAKAFVRDIGDNTKARQFRSADQLDLKSKTRFDAETKTLKSGDVVAANAKGQTIGYWFEDHAYGVAFKSAKDFDKFVKLCEADDEDAKPAKKEKAEKPAAKKGKQKPVAKKGKAKKEDDDDGDDDEEEAPKRKKPGKKEEPAAKKGKGKAKSKRSDDDEEDDDNWAGEDADSDDEDEAPKSKAKGKAAKSKKSDDDEEDDGEEPDIELDVDDDNTAQENAKAIIKALKKELIRLKVKSAKKGNVADLLELLGEYIDETASEDGDDEDAEEEEDDDSDDE